MLNPTLALLAERKSVRAYTAKEISQGVKDQILEATLRAPTAGNMMLYSVIEVVDPKAKATLAETCDHQPFIATAPLVLLFLADYQRMYDFFLASGIEELCEKALTPMRRPEEGDLFLGCCDALIAAQTAVIAAESLGVGSCYIGDIMENHEAHQALFGLPKYVFPIALVCFGYPTEQQKMRPQSSRFDQKFIVFTDRYRRFAAGQLREMYAAREAAMLRNPQQAEKYRSAGEQLYDTKFNSAFAREMSRSVRAILRAWID